MGKSRTSTQILLPFSPLSLIGRPRTRSDSMTFEFRRGVQSPNPSLSPSTFPFVLPPNYLNTALLLSTSSEPLRVAHPPPIYCSAVDDDDLLTQLLLLLRFLPPLLFAEWKWVHIISYSTTCVDGNIVIAVYAQK